MLRSSRPSHGRAWVSVNNDEIVQKNTSPVFCMLNVWLGLLWTLADNLDEWDQAYHDAIPDVDEEDTEPGIASARSSIFNLCNYILAPGNPITSKFLPYFVWTLHWTRRSHGHGLAPHLNFLSAYCLQTCWNWRFHSPDDIFCCCQSLHRHFVDGSDDFHQNARYS